MYKYILFCLVVFMMLGCGKRSYSVQEYVKFINDESNGMKEAKTINGIRYSILFLPKSYLSKKDGDSIIHESGIKRNSTYTFLLRIEEEEVGKWKPFYDLNFLDVENFDEYVQRFYTLNFRMTNLLTIESNSKVIEPVLYNSVNTYGMKGDLEFLFVFLDKDITSNNDITVSYQDDIFKSGTLKFNFLTKNLNQNL